ncbi:MAG TPA: maleylpyruvate isomerase family mycothiol-dependent enzyme [Dehalococcoidia bacterium]|nr:maleylpyruvate isomerase family mycothiol-dependent enzyme [Dehalococcoidia bacterium]
MTEKQDQILKQLNEFCPRLIQQLRKLSEDDWAAQSRCDDWTVKDVIAHLSPVLANFLIFITSAKKEENILDDPNLAFSEPGVFDGKSLAGRFSKMAKESSESFDSSEQLINEFELRFEMLLDGFNSCKDNEWDLKAFHPVNWVSVYGILLWTMFESTIHAWDALNAVDEKYLVDENLAPLLPQHFCNKLINRWFKTTDSTETLSQTLAVNLGSSHRLRISSANGELDIDEYGINSFDSEAEIHTSPSEFALLITGRKSLSESIEDTSTQLTGDQSFVNSFSRWFTGS